MAGLSATDFSGAPGLHRSDQLKVIVWLRWRLFVNALRTSRGQLELLSRILVSIAFAVLAVGGAFAMGAMSYVFLSAGKTLMLSVFLWMIFFLWQVFPIMATAFTSTADSSDLLRFPLSYGSFFLVRLAYGTFDPASVIGSFWTLGVLGGVTLAKPAIFPWAALVLLAFILFNLVFMQMLFAWIERWLAQRRTREILGAVFVLAMISFQLIAPLSGLYGRSARPRMQIIIQALTPVQGFFPPGLAADAIVQGIYPQWPAALSSLTLLCAFFLAIVYALHMRLLAQYRGENLSEVAAVSTAVKERQVRMGWRFPGLSAPVSSMLEKEIRYLMRSGPMLFALIMPMVMLILFRFGAMNSMRHTVPFFSRSPDLAFPVAAAYSILTMTNLIYNTFGGDAAGIQFIYASPVPFRDVILAKNLMHAGILLSEAVLAWAAVSLIYQRPGIDITIATLAGLLFAAPLNFVTGNILSLYAPRKVDFSKFGRQRASQLPALLSILMQLALVGVGVLSFWLSNHFGNFWIATLVLLTLAAASFSAYGFMLKRIDGLAIKQRETMVAELCKA